LEAASAVAFLHSKGVVHRDVKSPNFLVVKGNLKITDFGMSAASLASISTRTGGPLELSVGTTRWAAPEAVAQKTVVNEKSDVYSLGIVLWELAARSLPYRDIPDNFRVLYLVKHENMRPEIPADCPEIFSNIFTRCWDADSCKRPSAHEVHEYFKANAEEFSKLYAKEDEH
jgi:serine/threonine protein kinase